MSFDVERYRAAVVTANRHAKMQADQKLFAMPGGSQRYDNFDQLAGCLRVYKHAWDSVLGVWWEWP